MGKIFGRFGKKHYFCGVREQISVNEIYDFFLKLFSKKLAYVIEKHYLCIELRKLNQQNIYDYEKDL